LVQSLPGLNAGGSFRNQDSVLYRYGGYAEYRLNVDTGKLGLWPGGFLALKAETQFASFLESGQTGALLAPNAAASRGTCWGTSRSGGSWQKASR
jgi:hypothetical protein